VQGKAAKFLPVAVEAGGMMAAKGEYGDLFRKTAEAGHYGKTAATRTAQGTYLITPSGRLLASGNDQNPKATLKLMDDALAAWDKLPAADRLPAKPPPADARSGPKSKFPDGGLALDVSLRKFFPRPLTADPVSAKVLEASGLPARLQAFAKRKPETYWEVEWNQDHAWFTKEEARKLLPAELTAGAKGSADESLVKRLARLHLTDTVRALADAYPPECVTEAVLTAEVTGVKGDAVQVKFEGKVKLEQSKLPPFARTADETSPVPKRPTRGYSATLLGKATFDAKQQQFTAFEVVALGEKAGGSKLSPFEATTMGVTLTLAKPAAFDPIEPRYLSLYGWK
jgi:hypothetical protein